MRLELKDYVVLPCLAGVCEADHILRGPQEKPRALWRLEMKQPLILL